jgi:hypothetical protein
MIYAPSTTFYVKYSTWWNDLQKAALKYHQIRDLFVKGKVISCDMEKNAFVISFPAILEIHHVRGEYFLQAKARSSIPLQKVELTLKMFVAAEEKIALARMSKQFDAFTTLSGSGYKMEQAKDSISGREFQSRKSRSRYLSRFLPPSLKVIQACTERETLRLELNRKLSMKLPFYDLGTEFSKMLVQLSVSVYRSMARKKDNEHVTVILRFPPLLLEHAFVCYAKLHCWNVTKSGKGAFQLVNSSFDLVASSIAVQSHMPNFLNPMVRYYFTNSKEMLKEAQRLVGLDAQANLLCNPLDFTIGIIEYEQQARNELREMFPADAHWTKSKIREAVLEFRVNQNHCIGLRTKYWVRVSNDSPFEIEIRPGGLKGSFFIMRFKLHKESYKNSATGIKVRQIF